MLIGELYEIKESLEVTARRAANFKQGLLTRSEFNYWEAQATSHYGLLCAITQERRQPHGHQSIGHFLTGQGNLEKHALSYDRDDRSARDNLAFSDTKSIRAVASLEEIYEKHKNQPHNMIKQDTIHPEDVKGDGQ